MISPQHSARRVLIVGGGIAGLAMARALHERDIPFVVVERHLAAAEAGLGMNLPGNGVFALRQLGIADALAQRGVPIRRREYRNAKGRLLFAVDEAAFWGDVSSVCVRRGHLIDMLLRDVPTEALRLGTAVNDVTAGSSEARFADGETESYDFVVGADGAHSTVRNAVFGATTPRPALLSSASWRFMAPNPGIDCWTVWTGASGTFLLIPADADQVYGYASATRGGAVGSSPQWLHSTFADFPEIVTRTLEALRGQPESLLHSPVEEVRLPRWSQDRVVLIGDAAHATAPVWGQGAALAIEDAIVLSDFLATNDDWSRVGDAFEQQRKPRVAHVQRMTDRMSRIARLPIWFRDPIAPVVGPRSYRETYGPLREFAPYRPGIASSRPR
jgi:2-polyprenyl-6-methoxyphenol hydroxylase-like FAD-dependent oxidoreductase